MKMETFGMRGQSMYGKGRDVHFVAEVGASMNERSNSKVMLMPSYIRLKLNNLLLKVLEVKA